VRARELSVLGRVQLPRSEIRLLWRDGTRSHVPRTTRTVPPIPVTLPVQNGKTASSPDQIFAVRNLAPFVRSLRPNHVALKTPPQWYNAIRRGRQWLNRDQSYGMRDANAIGDAIAYFNAVCSLF